VLVLVGEQHLVDEAVRQQRIGRIELDAVEDLEGPLADLLHVRADLIGAEDRQLAADLARLLDRVVEVAQVAAKGLAPADSLDQPELLEVGDVPEIPDQRAEDRVVDPVELLLGEGLDQRQGVVACLLQAPDQLGLAAGSGTSPTLAGCSNLRDRSSLARPLCWLGRFCERLR
jgi:hypothetical protein